MVLSMWQGDMMGVVRFIGKNVVNLSLSLFLFIDVCLVRILYTSDQP